MNTTRDKIYDYEVTPPAGVWDAIANELDATETKVVPLNKKSNKILYLSLAAASAIIILFIAIFFPPTEQKEKIAFTAIDSANNKNEQVLMTVPVDEPKILAKDKRELLIAKNDPAKKNNPDNKIIANKTNNEPVEANYDDKSTYITVASPDGNSIKISEKAATLIDTSESKPVWNKKVKQWKEMMKGNTLAPTPGNFLDIMELTRSLKDKK